MLKLVSIVALAAALAVAPIAAVYAQQPPGQTGGKNAGGGPGNSGPGDKNSPDRGGGGVGGPR